MNDRSEISQEKEDELRASLNQEMSEPNLDLSKIYGYLGQLSKLDPDRLRFSVDAGLINRLGVELVGRKETAVMELVKNSYDADGTQVRLYFENTAVHGGRLKIVDDGLGMTREQIIDGFMRIASTTKIHEPSSVRYQRARAGRKGIGRFATQRLGKKLTILTTTMQDKYAYRIIINWADFEIDSELVAIESSIQIIDKNVLDNDEGTCLLIDELRDKWTSAMIKRVYRYLSDLLPPFPISRKGSIKTGIDPGFKVRCYRNGESVADEETMVFDQALAKFSGGVDEKGIGWFTAESKYYDLDTRFNVYPSPGNEGDEIDLKNARYLIYDGEIENPSKRAFSYLRNVTFELYYFVFKDDFLGPNTKALRDKSNKFGGIRVYKNDIRVLPYGERLNDWLLLNQIGKQSGKRGFPIRSVNFFGYVNIQESSALFTETASREGFVENFPYWELQYFVHTAIKWGRTQLTWARQEAEKKVTEKEKKGEEKPEKDEPEKKKPETKHKTAQTTDQAITDKGSTKKNPPVEAGTKRMNPNMGHNVPVDAEEKMEEVALLRTLSGLGLAIGQFTHEIKQHLLNIENDLEFILEKFDKNEELSQVTKRLSHSFNLFRAYTSFFDTAVSENVRRDLKPIEIRDVVKLFLKSIAPSLTRSGITLETHTINGHRLYTTPMHPAEWVSILLNFYTNSSKAIVRSGATERKIGISGGREGGKIFLHFFDNGCGIPYGIRDKIFEAFFTTSSPAGPSASENEEMLGTGLGLKIVRDTIAQYNGQVFLVEPPSGYTTCFRVEVPAATKEEILNHGY